jgi:hypothetical protein
MKNAPMQGQSEDERDQAGLRLSVQSGCSPIGIQL